MYTWTDGAYLMHHGIKGQRWGVRRFQNEDGSLTNAGRKRYGIISPYDGVVVKGGPKTRTGTPSGAMGGPKSRPTQGTLSRNNELVGNRKGINLKEARDKVSDRWNSLSDRQKTAIKVGAAVAATALVAYGAYKLDNKIFNDRLNEANSVIKEGRDSVSWVFSRTLDAHNEAMDTIDLAGKTLRAERPGSENYNRILEARDKLNRTRESGRDIRTYATNFIGRDGRIHTATGSANMVDGTYYMNNRTGFDELGNIYTRKDLRTFRQNRKRSAGK